MARRRSPFAPCEIKPCLGALTKGNQNKINGEGLEIIESVNTDDCFRLAEPNEPRWDYYIGTKRKGEIYLEVHEVSEDEVKSILAKANWLRQKIQTLGWPMTVDRPFFVAPTKGITPYAAYGLLRKRLALHKIAVVMKGDSIAAYLT